MHTAGKSAEEMKKMLKIGGKVNLPLHRKRDGIVQLFGKQGLYTVKLDIISLGLPSNVSSHIEKL